MADLLKDQEHDVELMNELFEKHGNSVKVANELSDKWTQKYGAEFRGFVKVEFDLPTSSWTLHCGNEHSMNFDNEEVYEMPERLRHFRELNLKNKK